MVTASDFLCEEKLYFHHASTLEQAYSAGVCKIMKLQLINGFKRFTLCTRLGPVLLVGNVSTRLSCFPLLATLSTKLLSSVIKLCRLYFYIVATPYSNSTVWFKCMRSMFKIQFIFIYSRVSSISRPGAAPATAAMEHPLGRSDHGTAILSYF